MNKNDLLREEIIRRSGVNPKKCMKCGKCSGTCPAYDEMEFHPHQFASMIDSGTASRAGSSVGTDFVSASAAWEGSRALPAAGAIGIGTAGGAGREVRPLGSSSGSSSGRL